VFKKLLMRPTPTAEQVARLRRDLKSVVEAKAHQRSRRATDYSRVRIKIMTKSDTIAVTLQKTCTASSLRNGRCSPSAGLQPGEIEGTGALLSVEPRHVNLGGTRRR